MERQRLPEDEKPRLTWHTAFIGAIQAELKDYADALEFYPEHQLTSEPLRIDCVIIKKAKDAVIKKNIAAIFREWNLLEYKSPDDYVSVSDFYKVYGYACLYASFENVPISGITISFVESRYPEKLIKHLREERDYDIEETGLGIYTVKGDILPIQIIDSRRLPEEENLWLRGLSNRISISTYLKIDAEAGRLDKAMLEKLLAYLYVVVEANPETAKEALKMNRKAQALEKVFEEVGWIAKWEARGKAEGQWELLALLESGKTIEEAKQILGLKKGNELPQSRAWT